MSKCCCDNNILTNKSNILEVIIKKYQGKDDALISVFQETQELCRYLPEEALEQINKGLKIPIAKHYSVITFYSQFHLNPRGNKWLECSRNCVLCIGGAKVLDEIEKQLKIKK
jgi:NADH-quinone oxidoreductase subunit E